MSFALLLKRLVRPDLYGLMSACGGIYGDAIMICAHVKFAVYVHLIMCLLEMWVVSRMSLFFLKF